MKKNLSFIILIVTLISFSGCATTKTQAPEKETIKTLDSDKIYHDYLPENDSGEIGPDIIHPE